MNSRLTGVLSMLVGLSFLLPAHTQPTETAQAEIDFLLQYIEVSGCAFRRNGDWHDSAAARAHLASKYAYLASSKRITSAEDFIDKAASRSSLSGEDYEVRCGACPTIKSNEWLRAVLTRYRVMVAARAEDGSS
jgi:Family of unknown function (DUF5329)